MARVLGIKRVQAALRKHIIKSNRNLTIGLMRGGLFLQRESMKIVPVDKNVLRPSARTRKTGTATRPEVTVSYGTNYAVYVHEDLNARHKSGKSAKFLEKPAREKAHEIARIIRRGARTGL